MDARLIDDAVEAIRAGRPVVLPTDTVYGLCASPYQADPVVRMCRLKGRDESLPTALLAADLDMLFECVPELRGRTGTLVRALLPGPLTLVLPNPARRYPWLTGTNPEAIGVRVPELEGDARAIVGRVGAVAATSANLAGGPDPRRLDDVPEESSPGRPPRCSISSAGSRAFSARERCRPPKRSRASAHWLARRAKLASPSADYEVDAAAGALASPGARALPDDPSPGAARPSAADSPERAACLADRHACGPDRLPYDVRHPADPARRRRRRRRRRKRRRRGTGRWRSRGRGAAQAPDLIRVAGPAPDAVLTLAPPRAAGGVALLRVAPGGGLVRLECPVLPVPGRAPEGLDGLDGQPVMPREQSDPGADRDLDVAVHVGEGLAEARRDERAGQVRLMCVEADVEGLGRPEDAVVSVGVHSRRRPGRPAGNDEIVGALAVVPVAVGKEILGDDLLGIH